MTALRLLPALVTQRATGAFVMAKPLAGSRSIRPAEAVAVGGATRLNDLVDVTITGGQEDDILQQNDSGIYVNVKVLSAGTY